MNMMATVPSDAGEAPRRGGPLLARFEALQDAAEALRTLVGDQGANRPDPGTLAFRPTAEPEGPLAALSDLCEMLEHGLHAVLAAREQGAEGHIAARTLLARFDREHARIFMARTPTAGAPAQRSG